MQGEQWTDAVTHVAIEAPAIPSSASSMPLGSFEALVAHATSVPEEPLSEPLCFVNSLPPLVGGGGAAVAFGAPCISATKAGRGASSCAPTRKTDIAMRKTTTSIFWNKNNARNSARRDAQAIASLLRNPLSGTYPLKSCGIRSSCAC